MERWRRESKEGSALEEVYLNSIINILHAKKCLKRIKTEELKANIYTGETGRRYLKNFKVSHIVRKILSMYTCIEIYTSDPLVICSTST